MLTQCYGSCSEKPSWAWHSSHLRVMIFFFLFLAAPCNLWNFSLDQQSNPGPRQWEFGVLTPGSQGIPCNDFFFFMGSRVTNSQWWPVPFPNWRTAILCCERIWSIFNPLTYTSPWVRNFICFHSLYHILTESIFCVSQIRWRKLCDWMLPWT